MIVAVLFAVAVFSVVVVVAAIVEAVADVEGEEEEEEDGEVVTPAAETSPAERDSELLKLWRGSGEEETEEGEAVKVSVSKLVKKSS